LFGFERDNSIHCTVTYLLPILRTMQQDGDGSISLVKSTVTGSGVVAAVDTPARYVLVQLRDGGGNPVLDSAAGKLNIVAMHTSFNGAQNKLKVTLHHHGDGLVSGQFYFNVPALSISGECWCW
jgi:hypothetical protein